MKATNQNPALGHLSRIEGMYNQMVTDLRSAVESFSVKRAGKLAASAEPDPEKKQAVKLAAREAANGGSLSLFVAQQKQLIAEGQDIPYFELSNLYRVFTAKNPQRMSLELYVRLCAAAGIGGKRMRGQRIGASNISLIDYLSIDNDVILKSFLELQYRDENKKTE